MEGNLRFKIDWASQLSLEGNLPVLLCFTLYLKAISKYKHPATSSPRLFPQNVGGAQPIFWGKALGTRLKPPGGLYLEGRFNRGFFALRVWGGLIFGGAYTRRGLFSEFYGIRISLIFRALGTNHMFCSPQKTWGKSAKIWSKISDGHHKTPALSRIGSGMTFVASLYKLTNRSLKDFLLR